MGGAEGLRPGHARPTCRRGEMRRWCTLDHRPPSDRCVDGPVTPEVAARPHSIGARARRLPSITGTARPYVFLTARTRCSMSMAG